MFPLYIFGSWQMFLPSTPFRCWIFNHFDNIHQCIIVVRMYHGHIMCTTMWYYTCTMSISCIPQCGIYYTTKHYCGKERVNNHYSFHRSNPFGFVLSDASQELVALLQERQGLQEEVDIRSITIEQLLKFAEKRQLQLGEPLAIQMSVVQNRCPDTASESRLC